MIKGKTLVTKGKNLVTKGKTLVTKEKSLMTNGKTLVTLVIKGTINYGFQRQRRWERSHMLPAGARIEGPVGPRNSSYIICFIFCNNDDHQTR